MPKVILSQAESVRVLVWKYGRPAEIWLSHNHQIADFIKTHNLRALEASEYPSLPMVAEVGAIAFTKSTTEKGLAGLRWPIPYPGGLRIPHLHYGQDVYLMKPEQWKEFSQTIIKDIHDRLIEANSINFDQLLELGQAAASLSR